jgi:hypothetical protein
MGMDAAAWAGQDNKNARDRKINRESRIDWMLRVLRLGVVLIASCRLIFGMNYISMNISG